MSPEMHRASPIDPPRPSERATLRVAAPVLSITGVWEFSRPAGHRDHRIAPGGHLIHLLLAGSAGITIDGRKHEVRLGDLVYYHGCSTVRFAAGTDEVRFRSVTFVAPGLAPAAADRRVRPAGARQHHAFADLAALAEQPPSPRRSLGMHARLLTLLEPWVGDLGSADDPWTRAELWLRDRRRFRPGLAELAAATGCSPAALRRSCLATTGLTMRAALARLRLVEARELLAGGMPVGETARLLGFRRTQELSRAYSRFTGEPPTRDPAAQG
jgi:AraC-like DNA-binding protein